MSILEELNDKFEAEYSKKQNSQIISEYKKGNPMEGMDPSVDEESPVYTEQLMRAKWVADHPAKVGYHKRFVSCWISFLFVVLILCFVFNSPLLLSVVGLFVMTPFVSGVFNSRGHIIDRGLNVVGAVLANNLTVAGVTSKVAPFDIFSNPIETMGELFKYIFGSFYEFVMFSFLATAVVIAAVKLIYPIIKRMYCNVPVEAVIVSYDKFRHYGTDSYSPVYQYVYGNKKYLKISPAYSEKEEGFIGACGEVIVDPNQPKDAILPEEPSKLEYIISAILLGLFAVMLLIYLLVIL